MINSLLSDCSSFVTQADHRVVVDNIFRRYYCEVTSVDELFVSAPLLGRLMGATEFDRAEGKVVFGEATSLRTSLEGSRLRWFLEVR